MSGVRYTRNLFLRGICVIYMFAFASFYVQIPGLYGNNGILPVRTTLTVKGTDSVIDKVKVKPTLLWFAPYLSLDGEYMMDVLALLGTASAFLGFVSQKVCTAPLYLFMWVLYFSLFKAGQTFMWYQWDVLLLEAGFLAVLLAPAQWFGAKVGRPSDNINLFLVRWLLFRVIFASGVVKLTSGCPTWWGLNALNVHFESQVIPTPLAWYAHHLPSWFLRFITAFSVVCETVIPFLFFFPVRSVRVVAFFLQVFLQVNIILTGNYNFYNLLIIVLCLSLLDDQFFYKNGKPLSRLPSWLSTITCSAVYGAVVYGMVVYFDLKVSPEGGIQSSIAFTPSEFEKVLGQAVLLSIFVALFTLACKIAGALSDVLRNLSISVSQLSALVSVIVYSSAALVLFGVSLVPYSTLHPAGNVTLVPQIRDWHTHAEQFQLVNAYGLFRRMTGVDGRPEIIIEGSNSVEGPWQEYNFLYKPGNVNNTLPFVAPYQPRLDWQMWFAALGTYHQNPWLMSLTYRLLTGQQEVLQLLDNSRNPFPNKPPKYIKASLYHYHYTGWNQRWGTSWWTREKVSEYFPIFARDHPPLLDYLNNMKILGSSAKQDPPNSLAKLVLDQIRSVICRVEPSYLLLSLFIAGCVLITTILSQPSSSKQSKSAGKTSTKKSK